MPGLMGHPDLVEEHLQHLLFIAAFALGLLDLLVHDLDGDALVGSEVDGHFDPA